MRPIAACTSGSVAQCTTPPALPRPPTGTCAFTSHGPGGSSPIGSVPVTSTARGMARPCPANNALPSASISSTSVGSQPQDALAEVGVGDDLPPHQVAQCFGC